MRPNEQMKGTRLPDFDIKRDKIMEYKLVKLVTFSRGWRHGWRSLVRAHEVVRCWIVRSGVHRERVSERGSRVSWRESHGVHLSMLGGVRAPDWPVRTMWHSRRPDAWVLDLHERAFGVDFWNGVRSRSHVEHGMHTDVWWFLLKLLNSFYRLLFSLSHGFVLSSFAIQNE